jgi:hypothetical protein
MSIFVRAEVWSDVECAGGQRLASLSAGQLVAAVASHALDGSDSLTLVVPWDVVGVDLMTRGRVVRVCYTDDYEEWRIRDTQDDADEQTRQVACDGIGLDLSRALYVDTDADGAAVTEFAAIGIDAEGMVDGPIRDALDGAGLTWITKGTITPTGLFDIAQDWASARSLAVDTATRTGTELRVRRDGTSGYLIDLVDRIGSSAPVVYARTARNLLSTQRTFAGALAGTRVVPRGRDDSTSRTFGYAYWEVVTTGNDGTDDFAVIRDPRGTSFPPPGGATVANRLVGFWLAKLQPTFVASQVLGSVAETANSTRVRMPAGAVAAQGLTAGDVVEFRLGSLVDSPRPWYLTSAADQAAGGGLYDRVYDRPTLTGAVNYTPNPFVRDFTGLATYTELNLAITSSTGSAAITTGGTAARTVQPGDILLRASDDAVVGTVLSVGTGQNATLTANALLTLSSVQGKIRRAVPAGARVDTGVRGLLWSQVPSNVAGVDSLAWRVERTADVATGVGYIEIPVSLPFVGTPTSWQIGVWAECEHIVGGLSLIRFSLRRADTGAQLGDPVELLESESGKLARVVFSGIDLSAATAGVTIRVEMDWQSGAFTTVALGPWWCQPAAWEPKPVEAPFACDLWHEANIFLDTQGAPISYSVDLADLASIDGQAFGADRLAIGGTLEIDDRTLGVRTRQRVVQMTRDLLAPGSASLTLGRQDKTLADILAAQSGLSVADIALALASGLTRDARLIAQRPQLFVDVSDGVFIYERNRLGLTDTADALRDSFGNA